MSKEKLFNRATCLFFNEADSGRKSRDTTRGRVFICDRGIVVHFLETVD